MKRINLVLSILLTSSALFGQVEFHKNGQPLGSTISVDSSTSNIDHFSIGESINKVYVVNTESFDQEVFYQRIRRQHTVGWNEQICDCDVCYVTDDIDWGSPSTLTLSAGDSCYFQPKVFPGGIDGCSIYTYIIKYGNLLTFGDSIQVTYTIAGSNCFLNTTESEVSLEYSVYPNPANSVLNISISENNTSISIFDVLGKNVAEMKLVNGNNTLNIENLNPGVYFYGIKRNGNIIETEKLIVR